MPLAPRVRLRTLLSLAPAEQRMLAWAMFLVMATRICLSTLRLQTTERLLHRLASTANGCATLSRPSVDRLVWAIRVSSRRVPGATCLTQALAARTLLARYGHSAQLRAGLTRGEVGRIEGHAWLEHRGEVVVGDGDLTRYTSLQGWEELTPC